MLGRMFIALAAAGALTAGIALQQAQAAPTRDKVAKTTSQKSKTRQVARHKKAVRKMNFTTARRQSATPAKKHATGVKVAALFGGASLSSSRADGRIYDASGRYLGKTVVKFDRKLKPGTILVKTRERALYYVLPGGKAEKYGVGVGRQGFTWTGRHRITMKKKWPEWRPPAEMKRRELARYGRKLPDVMPGGPENPLGARALYIGNTLYRIHGTNNPRSIGKFVSSGCIRMVNNEVIELFDKVKIGSRVIVED